MDKAACYLQCTPLNPSLSQLVMCPVKYPIHKANKVILTMTTCLFHNPLPIVKHW